MRRTTMFVVCALAVALCAGSAWAGSTTPPSDTLKVAYYSNANTGLPDGTLRLTNPGTAPLNICAAVFVFDSAQELAECCSCELTPDGLETLSVNLNLTSNTFTGNTLYNGVVKVVSTTLTAGNCGTWYSEDDAYFPTVLNPTPAVRGWITHIQYNEATTESNLSDATLSTGEVTRLQQECTSIALDGSGYGACYCGGGD